jgi:hypothetical protein
MTTTQLDRLMRININSIEDIRYKYFGVLKPKYSEYPRVWGEVGIMKLKSCDRCKLDGLGHTYMLVGCSNTYVHHTLPRGHPRTNQVH